MLFQRDYSIFLALFLFIPVSPRKTCYDLKFYLSVVLEKGGFHREIHYEVEYPSQLHDLHYDSQSEKWNVAVVHKMPSGLYVNPDEINDLKAFNMVNATVQGHVNIEMQASYYTENLGGTIIMYSALDNFKAKLWSPVHARYHPPESNGGFSMVKVSPGRLFFNAPSLSVEPCGKIISLPCDPHSSLPCNWWEIPYILLTDDIEWPVPIGNLSHYPFICGVTLFITLAGCLYIASSVFSTAQKQHRYKKRATKMH